MQGTHLLETHTPTATIPPTDRTIPLLGKDDILTNVLITEMIEVIIMTNARATTHHTIIPVEIIHPPLTLFHNGEIHLTNVDNSKFQKKHRKKF